MRTTKVILAGLLCWLQLACRGADREWIWIEANVNYKPARFVFDTGTPQQYVLLKSAADRLGIAVTNFDSGNGVVSRNETYIGYTPECFVTIRDQSLNTWFWVLESAPSYLGFAADGILGWPSVTNCVVMIDAGSDTIFRLNRVPAYARDWSKWPIQSGSDYLRFLVRLPGGADGVLVIDTGSPRGVKLRPDLWRDWKSKHSNQPVAMQTGFRFGLGVVESEEMWAMDLSVGNFSLTDVPVTEADAIDLAMGNKGFEATLGLAALKRLDLIVDPIHGVAYVRLKTEKAPPYQHNRFGLSFMPRDGKTNEFFAHVFTNGPAFRSGIRENDLLLKVDNRKIETAQDLLEAAEKLRAQPAGTKVSLTLRRGTNTYDTALVLKDIIGPDQQQGPQGNLKP